MGSSCTFLSEPQAGSRGGNTAGDHIHGLNSDTKRTAHCCSVHLSRVSSNEDHLIIVLHRTLYNKILLPTLSNFVKTIYTGDSPFCHSVSPALSSEHIPQYAGHRVVGSSTKMCSYVGISLRDSSYSGCLTPLKTVNLPKGITGRFCNQHTVSAQSIARILDEGLFAIYSKHLNIVHSQAVISKTVARSPSLVREYPFCI